MVGPDVELDRRRTLLGKLRVDAGTIRQQGVEISEVVARQVDVRFEPRQVAAQAPRASERERILEEAHDLTRKREEATSACQIDAEVQGHPTVARRRQRLDGPLDLSRTREVAHGHPRQPTPPL